MSRKHFEAIAAAIAATQMDDDTKDALARKMAQTLAATNERFDHRRFIEACLKPLRANA